MRVNAAVKFIIIALLLVTAVARAEDMQNNDEFVKTSFARTIDSLLAEMGSRPTLNLNFKCDNCPHDFYLNILTSILKQKVADLYIDNREKDVPNLEINLFNSGFYYEREGGSLFSSGDLIRKYQVDLNLILTDADKRLIWQNEGNKTFSEKIDWDSVKIQQTKTRGIFNAPLPSTNRSRIWEPVIISGLLGGLVYLFFASR